MRQGRTIASVAAAVLCSSIVFADSNTPPASLRVAAVQFRSSRDLASNTLQICRFIGEAAQAKADIVVFPECALTGYFEDVITNTTAAQLSAAEEKILQECRNAHIYAVVGTPFRDGSQLYNSAVVISPEGSIIERYYKVQLAERWPDAGDHVSVFPIDGIPCSMIICHDERYPELVRLPVLAGAKVIFYISHESGLRETNKIAPYRAQVQARAVENTVFLVQANAPANSDKSGSHGQSRIIAPDGNIIREASMTEQEVLFATLELKRATRDNARKSLSGPLRGWWEDGLKKVRIIQ
jgi:predicted amidohydrolase